MSPVEAGNPDSSLWLLFFPHEAQNTEQRTEYTKKGLGGKKEEKFCEVSKIFQCFTIWSDHIFVGVSSQNCLYLGFQAFTMPEGRGQAYRHSLSPWYEL